MSKTMAPTSATPEAPRAKLGRTRPRNLLVALALARKAGRHTSVKRAKDAQRRELAAQL